MLGAMHLIFPDFMVNYAVGRTVREVAVSTGCAVAGSLLSMSALGSVAYGGLEYCPSNMSEITQWLPSVAGYYPSNVSQWLPSAAGYLN